jgi:hypothetical protein
MKKSEVSELVLMLMAAYPSAKTGESTSAVYEQMLADLDAAAARKAVTRLIGTAKWLPTVAEIRAAATDLRLGPMRAGGEAWQDAMSAVRHVGRYEVPTFADPLVSEALRLWGSWVDFCNSPEDDPGGRARFIELYDSLATRQRQDVASGIPLPAPQSRPALGPSAPRHKPALVPAPAGAPVPKVLVAAPRKPEQSQFRRRMTAEEIQGELDKASGATP